MRNMIILGVLITSIVNIQATTIDWTLKSMTSNTVDSIIQTDGIYKLAMNTGDASNATVNGVLFVKAPGGTSGSLTSNGITIAYSAPSGFQNATSGDQLPEPGRYEPQLEYVMKPMLSSGYEGDITVTISGLTTGKSYHVQFLLDQSTAGNRGMRILQGSATSGDFAVGTSGHGESVSADFVADADSIIFTIHPTGGGGRAVLNGITVFEAVPTVVNWTLQPITDVTPDTIVKNDGIFKAAINLGTSSNATVNNLLFMQSPGGTLGSITTNRITISYCVTGGFSSDVGGDTIGRYSPQLEYVMLPMISTAYDAGQIDITISGLTVGHTYRVQFLHDQSSAGGRSMQIVQGDNISDTFSVGSSGHGESVLAEFVAAESSMKFSILRVGGGQRAVLNGVAVSRVVKGTMIIVK